MIKSKKLVVGMLDNFIWVLLIGLIIIGSVGIDRFFSVDNFMNIFYNSSSYGMMVLGMAFVMLLGQLDLSIESIYAFGPSIAVLCITKWMGLDPVLGILLTLGVGMLMGWINGLLSVKMGINPFLVTLCTMMIMRGTVLFLIPQGLFDIPSQYTWLGFATIPGTTIPIAVFIFVGIFIFADIMLKRTTFGKNLIATGSNATSAYLAGINISRIKLWAFSIAGLCAAMGGLLMVGRMGSVTNSMGDGAIMQVIAACILGGVNMNGGKGTAIGAMGGILFLIAVQNVLTMSGFSPFLIQVVQGLILLAAIVFDNLREKLYHRLMQA